MAVCIGITTSYDGDEQRLRHDYVRAVEAAGGVPVLLPMAERDAPFRALSDRLDGLLIPGGPAITTGLVGTLPDDINPTDPLRLRTDEQWLRTFLEAGKPVLGICYGMQLLNALAGGTIYADVERQRDGAAVHSQKRGGTTHPMAILPETHLHRLLGTDTLTVNTRHLQALATVGEGFRVAGRAPDGVIEAIENETGTIIGVQFHPERMGNAGAPLFTHLVRHASHPSVSQPAASK